MRAYPRSITGYSQGALGQEELLCSALPDGISYKVGVPLLWLSSIKAKASK